MWVQVVCVWIFETEKFMNQKCFPCLHFLCSVYFVTFSWLCKYILYQSLSSSTWITSDFNDSNSLQFQNLVYIAINLDDVVVDNDDLWQTTSSFIWPSCVVKQICLVNLLRFNHKIGVCYRQQEKNVVFIFMFYGGCFFHPYYIITLNVMCSVPRWYP